MPSQSLHVVILVRSFGFPNGMANTNRVRLLGRALVEQGVTVTVLCTRVSERRAAVRNPSARGVTDGIAFIYTPGSTLRSDSFLVRRYREARGFIDSFVRLAYLKRNRRLDAVYFWSGARSWRPAPWLMVRWLRALRVPVVVELNECPWTAPHAPAWASRAMSMLDAVSGAIAISGWLGEWAHTEALRIGRRCEVIEIPIVVDVDERPVIEYVRGDPPTLVYAASAGYDDALIFVLGAMECVWQRVPGCRLVVTGFAADRVEGLSLSTQIRAGLADGRVVAAGFVGRSDLLDLYAKAAALLIPLFDDARSQARFPSKLGEYMAAARPVVTTRVGEVERLLKAGETAYISPPGAVEAYAAQILEVLADPLKAAAIGAAGRQVAEHRLDYSLWGADLCRYFETISSRGQGCDN